ncbi:4-coumarate-CoA ligase 2 [Cryphonectria parasitica EP155]|uniref:4-coumarate-CoA ligase 2 n=1 Tax=Cryphonectria parasitica (strain ATCC 38755 / EP155) TaxID=660469 RepID=A0A9P4Y0Q3_CRYP1|nr:4-coumarate-CoA ligase 2 [Cryphonectria parasitica EP155]KAF3764411.1 4-coumarate-CoA ligase 2 [Cryphonectria parasitica EP155]
MPISSPYPPLQVEVTNVLDYAFPTNLTPSDEPLWIDSEDPSKALSARQALQWIKRTSFGLTRLGLQRGDVVMLYTTNHIFIPPVYYGIVGGGFVFSAANPTYTVPELVHQMQNLGAKVLLVQPELLGPALEAASQAGIPRGRIFQFTDDEVPTRQGIADWRSSMVGTAAQGNAYQWPRFSVDEAKTAVATINFSSGTTGLPKGVCISHANLIANAAQTIFMLHAEQRPSRDVSRTPDRYVGMLPLYHAFGQSWVMFVALRLQVPTYIMRTFRFEAFLQAVQRYGVTMLQVPPPVLTMLCKRPETAQYKLTTLREVVSGAAPLSRSLQNEVQRRFGVRLYQGWGMTEVTCGGMLVPAGVSEESGSVGVLVPETEARLVDEAGGEIGRPVQPGRSERGELFVRGPQVCLRYWRNEAATKETLVGDGWLRTGDVCVVDERGWFWIVDRKKELIKVNGLQVAPAELEQVLLENEHVADAAVVGITIDDHEWPRAYVELQASSRGKVGPENITEWIKPKVAKHKHLAGGVVFVDEVPRLQSGKIQRKVMKDWAKRDAEELQRAGKTVFKARI